jgi:hypothetical protein
VKIANVRVKIILPSHPTGKFLIVRTIGSILDLRLQRRDQRLTFSVKETG